jgi:EAL domain-containing protein (putative c-di-GMP-specific phosphodiesterase class I)
VLYYQPKVNMRTGTVIGAEALIRWQHPERGLLPPADFLPIIEDHPIGVELGEWVIEAALLQIRDWNAAGLDIPVSVNVGARQLQQGDFAARLSQMLAARPEVRPNQLELEVLETSALEDVAQVSERMHACRALGVSFALDDFGTGYSSLTYLKRLPANLLKIDQSFVRDMLDDPDDLAIVKGVIGLATAFRRKIIAEGVETVAHGSRLLSLGCDLAQGYGIARPMPATALPDWVAAWRPDAAWTTDADFSAK